MKKTILFFAGCLASFGLGIYNKTILSHPLEKNNFNQATLLPGNEKPDQLQLGAFSISLSVKDLKTSKEFYEKLGFTAFGGAMEQNYVIMKNENSLIGLFQGMFEGNILTFNPGWDENAHNIDTFDDVREIQRHLKDKGIRLTLETDEKTTGPGSIMLADPDGNNILVDQHR